MANAVELELDGSHWPKYPIIFREWRRKCGWCCSIARRSHHVRLLVLAAFIALNLCIFAFSSFALRCQVSRDLSGNNAASDEAIQAGFQKGYEVGYFQGAHQAYSYVFTMIKTGGDVGALMPHLANAGQPNVAQNTSFAGTQGQPNVAQNMSSARAQGYEVGFFEGRHQAYNIIDAMTNYGVHVGDLMQHLANAGPSSVTTGRGSAVLQVLPQHFLLILAQGDPLYGFVTSMPGVQSLLMANNAPTIPNPVVPSPVSAGRKFINPRSKPSSRNNCNRNDVGEWLKAPHRGNVVDHRFRSDGAKEFLGTLYHSEGVQLLPQKSDWFQSTTLVECHLFWNRRFDMRPSDCKETVCAWKCYHPRYPELRRVQGKNGESYMFDEEVFAGGQTLVCREGKCNTLPLRLQENVVLEHPFFGLMRVPSQVVCSWCEVTELFICASRAFKLHSGVKRKEVPNKRMLIDIVEESGEFFAKPANDSIIEFQLEDQYGYVQQLSTSGTSICVFEDCVEWNGPSSTGSVLVKRVLKNETTSWRVRVLAKDG